MTRSVQKTSFGSPRNLVHCFNARTLRAMQLLDAHPSVVKQLITEIATNDATQLHIVDVKNCEVVPGTARTVPRLQQEAPVSFTIAVSTQENFHKVLRELKQSLPSTLCCLCLYCDTSNEAGWGWVSNNVFLLRRCRSSSDETWQETFVDLFYMTNTKDDKYLTVHV